MTVHEFCGTSFHGGLSKHSGLPERPGFLGGLDFQGIYITHHIHMHHIYFYLHMYTVGTRPSSRNMLAQGPGYLTSAQASGWRQVRYSTTLQQKALLVELSCTTASAYWANHSAARI